MVGLSLPVQPRIVSVNDSVQTIKGKIAIAAGPVVYGFENIDNPGVQNYTLNPQVKMSMTYQPSLLNGVNVITGETVNKEGTAVKFTAIPFYSLGNRRPGTTYQVWMPKGK